MFAIPWMLGLLALGLIPIIIHIIFRQRYRRIQWAAMDFLLLAIRRTRRRLRLENLLLLILRVLAVIIMVLACAVPLLQGGAGVLGRAGAKHTVLVIDTSYSMGYHATGAAAPSNHARALREARQIIAGLREGDALSIIAMHDEAEPISQSPYGSTEFDTPAAIDRIFRSSKVALSSRGTSILEAMRRTLEVLESSPKSRREVILLTDLQRSGWEVGASEETAETPLPSDDPSEPAADRSELARVLRQVSEAAGGALTVRDLGADPWSNLVLESLDTAATVVTVGVPVTVQAVVWNPSASPSGAVEVEFLVGSPGSGGELAPKETRSTIPIAAGARAVVQFTKIFQQPGTHRLAARLRGDNLPADNFRTLALEVVESVPVLLVSGETGQVDTWFEDELGVLDLILDPDEEESSAPATFKVTSIGESEAYDLEELDPYQVIVLGNVHSLSAETAARLETWVQGGGGLFIFVGEHTISPGGREFYNQTLRVAGVDLLPAPLGEHVELPEDQSVELAPALPDHPILRPLMESPGIFQAWIEQFVRVSPPVDDDAVRVLVRYTGNGADPFLLERSVGRGRVLLCTTTADEEWNRLMASPVYVILTVESIRYLAARPRSGINLQVGEPLQASYPQRCVGPAVLTVPQPVLPGDLEGKVPIPVNLVTQTDGDGRAHLTYRDTNHPGFYVLTTSPRPGLEAGLWDAFAVNLQPREGDLTRIEEEELRRLAPGIELEVATEAEEVAPAQAAAGELPGWRVLLWILLLVLLLETLLARQFGDYGQGRGARQRGRS